MQIHQTIITSLFTRPHLLWTVYLPRVPVECGRHFIRAACCGGAGGGGGAAGGGGGGGGGGLGGGGAS